MSWHARRFNGKPVMNVHHVPPQNPATKTPFKVRVNKLDHMAYHQLFANAGTFEQCVEILWRDWWTPRNNNYTIKEDECVGCNLCKLICPVDDCITMVEQRKGPDYLNWKEFQERGLPLNDH